MKDRKQEAATRRRDRLMEKQLTPRIIKDLTMVKVKVNPEHVTHIRAGGGLFIKGDTGSGKTLYACRLALDCIYAGWLERRGPTTFEFIGVPVLLDALRSSYNPGLESRDEAFNFNNYMNTPLLILDDLGCERQTDWTIEKLYLLINHRYESLLPTIFTSNLDGRRLAQQLGDRVPSRIEQMCVIYDMGSKDYRIKKK